MSQENTRKKKFRKKKSHSSLVKKKSKSVRQEDVRVKEAEDEILSPRRTSSEHFLRKSNEMIKKEKLDRSALSRMIFGGSKKSKTHHKRSKERITHINFFTNTNSKNQKNGLNVKSVKALAKRIRSRDEELKKRLSGELSRDEERCKTTLMTMAGRKKEDNYKNVFPEIKLDFGQVSPQKSSKTQETQSAHSPVLSPPLQQVSTRFSRESSSYSSEKTSKESAETKESSLPIRCAQLTGSVSVEELKGSAELIRENCDLAPTPVDSENLELAPTPESDPSLAKSHKYDIRSQFIAMPEVLPYTGLPMIPNKDNGGDLIVNGVPFWVEINQEDVTVDESVLNAAVVLEVVTGRVSLINMPDEQIVLDVYEDWKVLRSRDRKCFNKDVLFGNTVRSMVNLFEGSEAYRRTKLRSTGSCETAAKNETLTIADPTTIVLYMRDDLDYLTEIEFTKKRRKRRARRFKTHKRK